MATQTRSRAVRRVTRGAASAAVVMTTAAAMVAASGVGANAAVGFNPKAIIVSGNANGGSGNISVVLSGQNNSLVNIPAIAPESLVSSCAAPVVDGKTKQTTLADVHAGAGGNLVLSEQAISDVGTEQLSDLSVGETQESRIEGLSVLAGQISADVLDVTAHTSQDMLGVNNHTGAGDPSPSGLTVVNLNVFGQKFNGSVPANTKVTISKGNYVVINEQKPTATGITVNAIDIHLAALGVFSGSAIVAHAQTSVKPMPSGGDTYSGDAYAANVTATTPIASVNTGHIANASVGCLGGTAHNQIAAVNAALGSTKIVNAGTATATVNAGPALSPNVSSDEDIQGVNLLGGLITADALHVTSTSNNTAGIVTSHGTTTFVNLVVNGQPIAANPAPNTKIQIPGLGTITLNKQSCVSGTSAMCVAAGHEQLYVTAIDVKISVGSNSFGLPISSVIDVAHADSSLTTG